MRADGSPDPSDFVIVVLASHLAGLRDRLGEDGFDDASEFVADLVEATDHYLQRTAPFN